MLPLYMQLFLANSADMENIDILFSMLNDFTANGFNETYAATSMAFNFCSLYDLVLES